MQEFLEETDIIDYSNHAIQKLARELSLHMNDDTQIAKNCFIYVRDHIRHSGDYNDTTLTCKASDVLKYQTGLCYAKSHLLAALLRANNIPTGFCYQRLHYTKGDERYCLHGFNAIYLESYGWYRVDARGNKEGINAQFTPPIQSLAFQPEDDETTFEEIFSKPLDIIVKVLEEHDTFDQVVDKLPDIEPNAL